VIAGLQRRYGTAHLLDYASAFMAVHGRIRHWKEPVARVHISLANAACHHAHQDLLRSWLSHLQGVDDPASVTLGHHCGSCLHRSSPTTEGAIRLALAGPR